MNRISLAAGLVLIAFAAVAAGVAWHDEKVDALRLEVRAAIVAEYDERSREESARREAEIREARRRADEQAFVIGELNRESQKLIDQINQASARNDAVQCLDRDAGGRLRGIAPRADRSAAGRRAGGAGGPAAP